MKQPFASALVALTVCLGAAEASAEPPVGKALEGAAAADVVALKNGGMLRGQISEKVPESHVVLVTLTGEVKRFEWDDIEYAGPASGWQQESGSNEGSARESEGVSEDVQGPGDEKVRPKITVHARPAHLTFKDPAGYTLHIRSGSAVATGRGGVAIAKGYDEICTAPCEATVPAGTHTLGLSKPGAGIPVESAPLTVPEGKSFVNASYTDRSGTRLAGLLVMLGGAAVGTAVMIYGLSAGDEVCTHTYCRNEASTGMVVGGVGLAGGGVVLGMVLMFQGDSADIAVKKDGAARYWSPRRVAARMPSAPGLAFRGVW